MRLSRVDRSLLAAWWFTVDRVLLAAIIILITIGVVLSLAASPAVAVRKGLKTFYFVERHLVFSALGFIVIVTLSFFSPSFVRRLALAILALTLISLIWVLMAGAEINGARRWLDIGGYSLQPSEFAKPALIVILAWLFAQSKIRTDMPALPLAMICGVVFITLIALQPDIGQATLIAMVWLVLYLLSGQRLMGVGILSGALVTGLLSAYFVFDHVRARFDLFLKPLTGPHTQLGRAMESFVQGGFFGRGPGEGTIKTRFPDAHNDFIFSVVAEEYGVLACLGILALFALIVLRCFLRAEREPRAADRLAIQGLALVFGLQALINMGVNVGLLPAKGMTLPFISAGGSSMLAISLTLGMLLSFTRRRVEPLLPDRTRSIKVGGMSPLVRRR